MYRKRLWPYITELIIFLFVISLLFLFVFSEYISVKYSLELVLFFILLVIQLVKYVFAFVAFSLLVIVDAVTNDYNTVTAEFIEQFAFKSSPFLTKKAYRNNNIRKEETVYFKIVAKYNKNIIILTSSEYFELKPNNSYQFTFGRKSNALVDVVTS